MLLYFVISLKFFQQMVHGILKIAQQSTRSLQHLCSHTKVNKDVIMTTHVPALKKCLEAFVFRVKVSYYYVTLIDSTRRYLDVDSTLLTSDGR